MPRSQIAKAVKLSLLLTGFYLALPDHPAVAQPAPQAASPWDKVAPLAGPRTKIRIALSPSNTWTVPLIYGVKKGYFARANIDVEIKKSSQPSIMFAPLLARGDFDLLPQTPAPSFYNLVRQQFNVKAVSVFTVPKAGRAEAAWLTVMKDKVDTIKDLPDLKGKVVEGAGLGTTANFLVYSALKKAGLTAGKDVKIQSHAKLAGDFLPVIKSNQQDVASAIEPIATQAEREGYVKRWKTFSDIAPWFQSALIVSSEDFLRKNGPAIRKFLEVYLLSCREVNASNGQWTKDTLDLLSQWTNIDAGIIRAMGGVPYCDANGEVSADSLDRAQKLWIETGALKEPIDVRTLIDPTPTADALKVIGRAQ